MIYKKTGLSYLLWAAYACLTGVMLANYAILFWQKKVNEAVNCGTVIFVFGVFAVAAGCCFLIRSLSGRAGEKWKISSHTKSLWEAFIALSLFFAGLLYRVSIYLQNSSRLMETSYYQLATVKAEEIAEPMIHGASYLYTMCLSLVLSFLGNKMTAAVWLQIMIQMVTVFLTFLTVRRLAGRIPACIAMLVLAFSSVYAKQILAMTPESLFFAIYLMGMFIVGGYVKNNCMNCQGKSAAVRGAIVSGFVIGFLAYLDVGALTLLVFLPGLVTGVRGMEPVKKRGRRNRNRGNTGFSILLILTAIAAGALAFAGLLVLNAYSYYMEAGEMAEALFVFYKTHFQTDYMFYQTEFSVVECFVIVALAAFLIPAFWNRRKVQNASPWMFLMLLLAPTPLTRKGVLPYQAFSIFLWGVLAGIGVQQSFVWERTSFVKGLCGEEEIMPVEGTPIEIPMVEAETVSVEIPMVEAEAVSVEIPAAETEAAPAGTSGRKPRFLKNPLPLPKKHEKRTMDYQYEVAEEQLKFDYEIDEDDDFDIG